MKDSTILALADIGALCYVLTISWLWGLDHLVLAGTVAAISGLAEYELKRARG